MAAETEDAKAAGVPVKIIFVERAGSGPAEAAGVFQSHLWFMLIWLLTLPVQTPPPVLQAKIEVEPEKGDMLRAELKEWTLSGAAQQLVVVTSVRLIVSLEQRCWPTGGHKPIHNLFRCLIFQANI